MYNEEITYLLAPEELLNVDVEDKQKKQLPLMEDDKYGVLVRGLEEEIVANASEIFTLLERELAKCRIAETLLNKQSSRSHYLFSITIHIKESTPEGEELIKCGKLNLVGLADLENISRSGARKVLYSLSSLTCTDDNFITQSGAQHVASSEGVALIAPDTSPRGLNVEGEAESWDFGVGVGFYLNSTHEKWKNWRMYDYVVKELPSVLSENFPELDTTRASISGHSMGGDGALKIYLKNLYKYKL